MEKYERIIKGGCWYKPASYLEIKSYRTRWKKSAGVAIGFRLKFRKEVMKNEKINNI